MKTNFKTLSLIALLSITYMLNAQPGITACPGKVAATYPAEYRRAVNILLIEASYQDIARSNPSPVHAQAAHTCYMIFRTAHPDNLEQLASTLPFDIKQKMLTDIKQYYPKALIPQNK